LNGVGALKRILVVDDDKFDHLACRRLLRKSGCEAEIVSCYYARDALDYLRHKDNPPCDAILLDINMPAMNGLEFLAVASGEFGDAFAREVVAIVSTSMDPRDQEHAEQFDAVKAFFSKPLTLAQIEMIGDLAAARHPG